VFTFRAQGAPTLHGVLGLPVPPEMTGRHLRVGKKKRLVISDW
jgi:hypothetical protein